jgi:ribosomal-protein-alanine N-acetyltransferase
LRICLAVRERNLDAQLFFRSQGFRAVTVIHRCYEVEEDSRNEDAIIFQFSYRPEDKS